MGDIASAPFSSSFTAICASVNILRYVGIELPLIGVIEVIGPPMLVMGPPMLVIGPSSIAKHP
jgi:hypothetical protein